MNDDIPDGFAILSLRPSGFIGLNGPIYGRREDGRFVMGIRIEERHCNPVGRCHGGMLATLADMLLAMGSNIEADLSSFLLTVNLTCDFLGSAERGAWVEGRVDVLKVTRKLVFSQGLLAVEGAPIVRTSGILQRPAETNPDYAAERLFARS